MMIELNQWEPLIRKEALKAYYNLCKQVEYDDCLQQGYLIFCKALKSFDNTKGASFGTWLYHQLKGLPKEMKSLKILPGEDEFVEGLKSNHIEILSMELSADAKELLILLLNRELHRETQGPGRSSPGKKTVYRFMKEKNKWTKGRTKAVWEELKSWWLEQTA